jgi:predicted AAA+ superfamily ATPase
MKFTPRRAIDCLARRLRDAPAVVVMGPRQCGKSTLVRQHFPEWRHVDLERPADLEALRADIEGFFEAYPGRVVLDEAQRLPELFPVLRWAIDRSKKKGRFILLGSADPVLLRTISESLAGRTAILELTPFRGIELTNPSNARDRWFWGGYPGVLGLRSHRARSDWFDAYVSAVLERDLPALGFRLAPARLRRLWTMLTHVHGQVLNVSDLARSLTTSSHTVNHYLDVLEGAFLIRRLPPFHANVQKRLTKSPKVYVRDTGILHFLAGLRTPKDLETWPRRGHSFEGLVIEEIVALAQERVTRPEISFYRTHAGAEVDLVIKTGRRLIPIEIKLGAAVDARNISGLRQLMKDLGLPRGWVVSTARERRQIGTIEVVPWADVLAGTEDFGLGR